MDKDLQIKHNHGLHPMFSNSNLEEKRFFTTSKDIHNLSLQKAFEDVSFIELTYNLKAL